jgi:hypothetical protein
MAHSLTINRHGENIKLETGYDFGANLSVQITAVLPLVDATFMEAQALACEEASKALSERAQWFRQQIALLRPEK